MSNLTGQIIGKYQVLEKIGDGGMAEVYRAYHPSLNRDVAIKFIRPEFTMDERFCTRFEREARISASLTHPNIVPIFDYGLFHGRNYLVMEYIPGVTLKEYLKRSYASGLALTLDEIVTIITQIGEALTYIHQAGIIHRDIKPDNILITNEGRVCLTDFGVARITGLNGDQTASGAILGTPAYMSPEHILSDSPAIGPSSDLYSLGVILYEMLTGRTPFTANTPILLMIKHLKEPIPNLANPRLDLPDGMEDVVRKALAKDPTDRYQKALAFNQDLKEALEMTVRLSRLHPEPAIC